MALFKRPRLTLSQISELKCDVKRLSNIIKNLITQKQTFPVVATQNAIAKELGFTSFSELVIKNVPIRHHNKFSLTAALDDKQVSNAYSSICTDISVPRKTAAIAISELNDRNDGDKMPCIDVCALYDIINNSQYSEHEYKSGDGFPSKFTVSTSDTFFDSLFDWGHFVVRDGEDDMIYTVNQFDYIYDNKTTLFNVVRGKWFDNGFCAGY